MIIVFMFSGVQASELIDACVKRDVSKLKQLISTGVDLNAKDERGIPALVLASYLGYPEIAKLLIDGGANVNDRISGGWDGFMAYVDRVKAGKEEPQLTLDKFWGDFGIDPNDLPKLTTDQEEELNALMIASYRGHEQIVDMLLQKNADVNAVTKKGYSPLIFAATKNHPEIVKKLIDAGAGIDHRDKKLRTALVYSILSKSYGSFKVLLTAGASTDDKLFSQSKHSPLQLAAYFRNFQMVKDLVEAGADVNFMGLSIKNAFVYAVENGDYEIAKYLLEKGSDINTNGLTGPSPLKIAKMKGYKEIEQLLIEHNASE
jgi:ankyrin repeat protein